MSRLAAHTPHGLMRWLLRAPLWLYRMRLGWLFDDRALMLTHIGRKSSLPHRSVLEVVTHDPATDTYIVASGWGRKADWFRNIQKTPAVQVDVGRRHFAATAQQLGVLEAEQALLDYARRHPIAFRELVRVIMDHPPRDVAETCHLMAQTVPLVALRPDQRGKE